MCSILGAISGEEIEGSSLKTALDTQKQRGPDDEGYRDIDQERDYIGPDSIEQIEASDICEGSSKKWFAHRRLSITGGKSCRQPMTYKSLTITFEGEIYNYRPIRSKLKDLGHSFETEGDTEIFLHAFDEWGMKCVSYFEGKWSAGIFDSKEEKLYCMRDHFGTKPLYYYENGEDFYFSSTISPILELKENCPKVDSKAKQDYLIKGMADHSERTFFEEVKQLRPKEYLMYTKDDIEIRKLPEARPKEGKLREICEKTIKSKVPEKDWCLTVSGGLDSSIVAATLSSEDPPVYAADIAGELYESSVYREKLAENEDLNIKEIKISREDLIDNIEASMKVQEEPTIILVSQAQNILLREISKDDRKVVITGSGADEIFLGYKHFVPVAVAEKIRDLSIFEAVKLAKNHWNTVSGFGALHLASLILKTQPREWIKDKAGFKERGLIEATEKISSKPRSRNLTKAITNQLESFWYPSMKRQADKNAGAYGLELREAFLSQELLQHIKESSKAENLREGQTKRLLKDCFKQSLPDIIRERSEKTGFVGTDDRAFTPEIKKRFIEKFRSESFRSRDNINSVKVLNEMKEDNLSFDEAYRLYSYEIWARTFLD